MSISKISRLIQLIGLLQVGKGLNPSNLAEHCRVSRRTIFRDLEVLRRARVPLIYDSQAGLYRIPGTYFLPPTHFNTEEALAVMVLCRELGQDRRLPFYGAARAASLKLESSLPAPLREEVRELTAAVQIRLEPNNPLEEQRPFYNQLLACIAHRQAVRIQYDSFSEQRLIETKLCPYRLLFSRHSWYVIGRSSMHREVRTFNVGRVRSLARLDDPFQIPRAFSVERYLGNAWHLITEPGPDFDVRIRFEPLVARNVAEVTWHKTQDCLFLDDGRMDFSVTVSGLNEISWWILGYGDQAEVLQPEPLRNLIRQRAARLLERYDKLDRRDDHDLHNGAG
jgi:proteasome accessory factor B